MSAGKKGLLQAAYPVWVGSLDASVDEGLLTSAFQQFGKIHSAVVQRDEFGRSKCFGYVNFTSQSKAEKAASAMNSKSVGGKKIKTKGPRMLQTEGHFVCGGKDYRPLTDCRYFMKRGHCKRKKKKLCPYRHNDIARYTTIVCKKWQERECLNKDCIMLHPGGLGVKRSSGSNNDEADDGVDVMEYSTNNSDSSSDESVSSATFSTTTIGSNRMSNEQVAKMMDLDFDDNDDNSSTTATGKSRLRRKASSSSSSSSISDYSDDEIAPARSHRSSKSKLNKSNSRVRLDEGSLSSDGEEAVVKTKHSKTRKTSGGSRKTAQAPLEPVGIFWDIENCKVPNGRSAFYLAQKFRQHFVEGKREVEFMCVCDTLKETGEVINDLNKAHVTVVHVSAVAKNAADDKLRVSLRRFADTYNSPATVVMVTSDVNFSNDLHDLRHRHMFSVILVHNQQVSYALKACAHVTIVFEEFIADIPTREQDAAMRATYVVIVKGFSPSLTRFKVKDKLLYLTENCGGSVNDVCDIKSGTARVRFRTYESALRAQRRLHGVNFFGYPLSAILEQPQQPQPRPQPMSWQVNDHPLLPQSAPHQQHMLQPHPFQQPPRPNIPINYNLSASFPPSSGIPFNNPPVPPSVGSKKGQPIIPSGVPPEFYLPKPPHSSKPLMNAPPIPPGVHMSQTSLLPQPIHRDQEVIIVGGKGRIVIDTIKAVLDKTLVAIPTNKLTGEIVKFCLMTSVMIDQDMTIYWHGCMQYIVVVTVDLMKTSQVIQTGPTPSDVLHNQAMGRVLLRKCCDVLMQKFQSQQLPWNVYPCTWPQQQEEMIKIRSRVIKILKEHDYGWANWTSLSIQYNNIVKGPSIIPAQLEVCCQGAVELQGANMATMVAMLTEMSPNICVSAEPSVPRRLVRIIKKYSDGVPLLNLVGMYWKEFGPLPMEKNGKKVLDLVMSQKGITYNGNIQDWITVNVYMVEMSKTLGLNAKPAKPSLNELCEEFRTLLINAPGQRVILDQFQPSYQTYYKKSFRVSDYGKDKLVDLLTDCPHLKLISNMVYLRTALMDSNSSPLHVMSSPAPNISTSPTTKASSFCSPPEDNSDITELHKSIKQILTSTGDGKITLNDLKTRLTTEQKLTNANYFLRLLSECDFLKVEEDKDGKAVSWSDKWLAERKKTFAKECKEVLSKEKTGEMSLKKFPEEFYRINKRQLICAEYGYKKLLNMLENVSGVEVITTGNQSTIKLTESAASNMPSLSLIKLQLEEYLWRCPDHTNTQVKLKPGFETSTKYKLDYSAYGFSKLTFMLEAMSDTIKLTGDGPNRLVSLQPLRKFACEVRQVMQSYPTGLCFSNFAPAFRSCLGYECIVGHYGSFTKLSQLFEGIPDTAKIIGEGMSKKVYLTHSKIASNVQVTMPTKAGDVAWNILRMLVGNSMIPLGDLAGHYNNAFSHQIKLSNYGYSNMEAFLSSLPSIVVKEQDAKKVVTSDLPLLFVRDAVVLMVQCQQHSMKWTDFLLNYELNSGEPFDIDAYDGPSDVEQLLQSCSPWIMVDNTSSGMILRLPPFARTDEFTEAVNNSNIKLKSSGDDGELTAGAMSAGKDYRRLLSETKRLLLMSPTYSLTLAQILKHFVANGDPICTSTTELHHVLTSTQNSFMFNAADCVVAVDLEARKKKLSKDFLYLFNELNAWQLDMTEMGDCYEECFYSPLEPHLYGCGSIAELVRCKFLNQILEVTSDGACVLSYAGKLNVLAARFAELLFTHAAGWVYIDCFDTYQKHFGTSLELSELKVDSIEELINKPNLRPVVMTDGGILKLRSQAMLAESLRHLLSVNNGKLQLTQLPQLFRQAFGHLPVVMEDTKIQDWISSSSNNSILSNASQVVHLNNNQWLVWAPGAYRYPSRTIGKRHLYSCPPSTMTLPGVTVTTTSSRASNDNAHILHGHEHISSSSNVDGSRLTAAVLPSNGKKVAGGAKKKNMAIKFPSASMIMAKEDIPALIESSNDEL